MGTFAPSTHPPLSCMCSAAPQWLSHTRELKITGFCHVCFSYQAGKPHKGQDGFSADSADIGLLHPRGKQSLGSAAVMASQFSTSSTNRQEQPGSSVLLLCALSAVLRTQLLLQSHCTPNIDVLHSLHSLFIFYISFRAKNMF